MLKRAIFGVVPPSQDKGRTSNSREFSGRNDNKRDSCSESSNRCSDSSRSIIYNKRFYNDANHRNKNMGMSSCIIDVDYNGDNGAEECAAEDNPEMKKKKKIVEKTLDNKIRHFLIKRAAELYANDSDEFLRCMKLKKNVKSGKAEYNKIGDASLHGEVRKRRRQIKNNTEGDENKDDDDYDNYNSVDTSYTSDSEYSSVECDDDEDDVHKLIGVLDGKTSKNKAKANLRLDSYDDSNSSIDENDDESSSGISDLNSEECGGRSKDEFSRGNYHCRLCPDKIFIFEQDLERHLLSKVHKRREKEWEEANGLEEPRLKQRATGTNEKKNGNTHGRNEGQNTGATDDVQEKKKGARTAKNRVRSKTGTRKDAQRLTPAQIERRKKKFQAKKARRLERKAATTDYAST